MTTISGVTIYTGVSSVDGVSPVAGATLLRGISAYATSGNVTVPVITSNGGGPTAIIAVAVPDTAVTTVTATGTAPVTFMLSGGADESLFQIDAASGDLAFNDASVTGNYTVIVAAVNLWGVDTQTLTVEAASAGSNDMLTESGNVMVTESNDVMVLEA